MSPRASVNWVRLLSSGQSERERSRPPPPPAEKNRIISKPFLLSSTCNIIFNSFFISDVKIHAACLHDGESALSVLYWLKSAENTNKTYSLIIFWLFWWFFITFFAFNFCYAFVSYFRRTLIVALYACMCHFCLILLSHLLYLYCNIFINHCCTAPFYEYLWNFFQTNIICTVPTYIDILPSHKFSRFFQVFFPGW